MKVNCCQNVLTNLYCCRLYNKDAVIEFLLDKSSEKALAKAASHIKNIKVTQVILKCSKGLRGYGLSYRIHVHYRPNSSIWDFSPTQPANKGVILGGHLKLKPEGPTPMLSAL